MKLVDANVLLYAVNEADSHHEQCLGWLNETMNSGEVVGFAWVVLLAFIRLSTKVGLFPNPLSVFDSLSTVRTWIETGPGVIVQATPNHLHVLAGLLSANGTGGNLTTDAHLGALALEYNATIITFDADFGRFPGVKWAPPSHG